MLLVFIAVIAKEGANVVLPSVLPELETMNADTLKVASMLPAVHVGTYAVGKASQIAATYALGGRVVLCTVLILSAIAQQTIASADPSLMLMGTALNAYANAHVWGAAMRITSSWAAAAEVGRAVGLGVALANDFGLALFSLIFAWLQQSFDREANPYMHTFSPYILMSGLLLLAALLQMVLLRSSAVLAGFDPPALGRPGAGANSSGGGHEAPVEKGDTSTGDTTHVLVAGEHPLDGLSLGPAIRSLLRHGRTYLAMGAFVMCACTMQGGVYVSTYATRQLNWKDEDATLLGVISGLGAVVGAVSCGLVNDAIRPPSMWMLHVPFAVLGVTVPSSLALMHIVGAIGNYPSIFRFMLFVQPAVITWFGTNTALFVIRFAGPTHCSALAGMCDTVGMIAGIPLQFYLGNVVIREHLFTNFLVLTAIFSGGACILVTTLLTIDDTLTPYAQALSE